MRNENKLLFDIPDSCRLIAEFLDGMERAAFEQDIKTQSAVLYQLSIVGEAVKSLPDAWRKQHPAIPWTQIARMRDHLIHRYFSVDIDTLWQTATSDAPALLLYVTPFVTALLQQDTGTPPTVSG